MAKGVWHVDRPGRPNAFGVQWRETVWDEDTKADRIKTNTEFFDTAEKRGARAAKLRKDKRAGALNTASRGDIDKWKAFKSAVQGTPWQNVVAGWKAWLMQNGIRSCTTTVETAVDASLAQARAAVEAGKMSGDHERQRKHKLGLFKEQFGHLTLDRVTAAEVEAWIDDFDEVESEATFNNYRKHVRALFSPFVEAQELMKNPIDAVKKRDDSTGEVGILTVQETAHLFLFAMNSERYRVGIGRLALEFFIGLRFSSGCRLEKKDINFEDRGVNLPKSKLKTKKRHYIDGLPVQLWDWLAISPEETWDLTGRQYMELKSLLFADAGVPHPHNCARHSFATYDVAANKNPGRTAYILCHRDQDLLWSRYKGNATEADGKRYQSITPKSVRTLAKGYVPLRVPVAPAPAAPPGA